MSNCCWFFIVEFVRVFWFVFDCLMNYKMIFDEGLLIFFWFDEILLGDMFLVCLFFLICMVMFLWLFIDGFKFDW